MKAMKPKKLLSILFSVSLLVGCSAEVEPSESVVVEPTESAVVEPSESPSVAPVTENFADIPGEGVDGLEEWMLASGDAEKYCEYAAQLLGLNLKTEIGWSGDQPEIPTTSLWFREKMNAELTAYDLYGSEGFDKYSPVLAYDNGFYTFPGCMALSPVGAVFGAYTAYTYDFFGLGSIDPETGEHEVPTRGLTPIGYSLQAYDGLRKTAVVGIIETTNDALLYDLAEMNPNITKSVEYTLTYGGGNWEVTHSKMVREEGIAFNSFRIYKPEPTDTFIDVWEWNYQGLLERDKAQYQIVDDWFYNALIDKKYTPPLIDVGGVAQIKAYGNLRNLQRKLRNPEYRFPS
jgi:hypothetical protein